ncbi:MAG TPA: hypothetical protein VME17_26545 [Bryobacteraceae bacterium]|nr:hypothetical protein [Bryobacteraceae bacterium]
MLTALQMEAEQTARHAAYVENLANSPGIDWKAAASQLNHIRAEVDNMDQRIYQLDVIQRMVPPWERRAIDDAGLLVSYMAVNADSALHNAAARQKDPTGIRTDLQRMDRQANELARAMSTDARSARVDLRTMFLQPNLGMLEVFGK